MLKTLHIIYDCFNNNQFKAINDFFYPEYLGKESWGILGNLSPEYHKKHLEDIKQAPNEGTPTSELIEGPTEEPTAEPTEVPTDNTYYDRLPIGPQYLKGIRNRSDLGSTPEPDPITGKHYPLLGEAPPTVFEGFSGGGSKKSKKSKKYTKKKSSKRKSRKSTRKKSKSKSRRIRRR